MRASAPAPEVEHFHPKSAFPALTNEWSNLFLACPHSCNQRRMQWKLDGPVDRWPKDGLLDPGVDDIEGRLHQTAVRVGTDLLMTAEFSASDATDFPAVNTAKELTAIHDETRHGRQVRSDLTARISCFQALYMDWSLASRRNDEAEVRVALVSMRRLLATSSAFAGLLRSWAVARFRRNAVLLELLELR